MDIFSASPSWDFLIAASLLILSVYGFIVGESKTVKAMLCIYPAFFVADIFSLFIPSLFPNISLAVIQDNVVTSTITLSQQISSLQIVVGIKLLLFFVFWITLIRLSFFEVEANGSGKHFGNLLLFGVISLSFALLFVNVVLLLSSGWSVVGFDPQAHVLEAMASGSFLGTQFVRYHGVFFAIPALILILSVFLYSPPSADEDEDEE